MSDKLPESLENLISLLAESMTDPEETGNNFLQRNIEQPKDKDLSIAQLSNNLSLLADNNRDELEASKNSSHQELLTAGTKDNTNENNIENKSQERKDIASINIESIEENSLITEDNNNKNNYLLSPPEDTTDNQEKDNLENIYTAQYFLQQPDNPEAILLQDWITK